jgi:hypothetical protein
MVIVVALAEETIFRGYLLLRFQVVNQSAERAPKTTRRQLISCVMLVMQSHDARSDRERGSALCSKRIPILTDGIASSINRREPRSQV